MPAPECTCCIVVTQFDGSHLHRCPLHEAAADLYEALELLFEPDCGRGIYSDLLRAKVRAALLKANPQCTQEQKDDAE